MKNYWYFTLGLNTTVESHIDFNLFFYILLETWLLTYIGILKMHMFEYRYHFRVFILF